MILPDWVKDEIERLQIPAGHVTINYAPGGGVTGLNVEFTIKPPAPRLSPAPKESMRITA